MAKSRKNKTHVKKVCKTICGKSKKILGNFVRNKRYLNKLNKKCTTGCVKKYTRKNRNKNRNKTRNKIQRGGSVTGVLPSILTNLIDGVSHSALSTIDVFNGYPTGPSPLPFLGHYKSLL